MRVIIYGAGENCKSVVGKIQKKDEILCIADKDALKIGGGSGRISGHST